MSGKRPNLLILHTDQQSTWTLGIYGGKLIGTPNIDSIGEEGAVFNNFFCNHARCSPSRACMLTGRYPFYNGVYTNALRFNEGEVTIAHILAENGYDTAYRGKWHLDGKGKPGWVKPQDTMGFNDAVMYNRGHWKTMVERPGEEFPYVSMDIGDEKTYPTDWLADKTIEYIKKPRENPFFLMVSIPDPHPPFNVRAPFDTMYDPEEMPVPDTFYEENLPVWVDNVHKKFVAKKKGVTEDELKRIKAQYCGEVKCIEYNVGRILNCLSEQGILDDTIVVFTSDHGEYMGEHGLLQKNQLYETAYKIPLVIRWPEKIIPGTEINSLVDTVDFQQTILGLMDIKPCGREQGRDASPLLTGHDIEWEDNVYIYRDEMNFAGVFTDKYQLVLSKEGGSMLFDRENDPKQINNLFENPDYKEVVRELGLKVIEHHRYYNNPQIKWLADMEKDLVIKNNT